MQQNELMEQISNKDLKKSLILSQILFIGLALLLSLFLFSSFTDWFRYVEFDLTEIIYYGILSGFLVVIIDLILVKALPSKHYDDGGINKRIFSSLSYIEIIYVTFLIAVAEELLFRGVLQTVFGYMLASTIFAVVHFRYLNKPVLFVSIVVLSFFIGYIFELTENLLVTITTHFLIDFLLGVVIRYRYGGGSSR
ncbi:hypothetical protein SAMN05216389_102278 [Oceanobacillus limi]|uniref:CAAX prenyl protease 2/Lysostaphin resistance protein A-like domain-containing protein n=1 Tax=Oceanobacillus limi TaxID=930131 RepID=A0A1H9ZHZ2_9BACI|nr:CPBP family intramembrane glutamic endopeptidase [Oceanobacillus limi]SES81216.1 hypothetical protein SAMN05216389_102278 [Oceanobacillus limi]